MNTAIEVTTREQNALAERPAQQAGDLVSSIINAAMDPSVDVDKMERLLAMAERMQAQQAKQAFAGAMRATQSETPTVKKDRWNDQTKSWYATQDAIVEAITPIYTRHGISLSFGTKDSPLENHLRVTCRVMHVDGHSEEYEYDSPFDLAGIGGKTNKTLTHARGSAVTYGRRYLTRMIFNLATGDDDDGNAADKGGVEPITEEQAANIQDMLNATEADVPKFLEWLGVERVDEIPADRFDSVMKVLRQKEQAK